MEPTRIQRILKSIELAARRAFIRLLSSRSLGMQHSLPLDLGDAPSILFLRQDRLGDAIVSTPLFVALRAKYPNGRFSVLLGKNNIGIKDLLPIDCEVLVYKKNLLDDIAMLRTLRNKKFDVAIDMMDNPSATSSMLMAAIAPKYSIGIEKDNASSYNVRVPLIDRSKYHISRRIAELLRPFSIDPESISLTPVLKPATSVKVAGRIGYNLSAGVYDRYLRPAVHIEVINGVLTYDDVYEVLILSHPNDRALAEQIVSSVADARVRLAPTTTSFKDFAEQIASCAMLISPDTSAVHIAGAYSVPVLAMYLPQPVLHYWTPVGVDYEMIVHGPTLETLRSTEVLAAFGPLYGRLHHLESREQPQREYVA